MEAVNPALVAVLPRAASIALRDARDAIAAAQTVYKLNEEAAPLLRNPLTFASCLLSVNAQDDAAQALQGRLQKFQKRYGDLLQPWSQFLDLVPDDVVDAYLSDPDVAPPAFVVRHGRERRHELLSLEEESLINGLSQDGIHAWGRLYDQLSGTTSCQVLVGNELRTLGLAEAGGLLQQADEHVGKKPGRASTQRGPGRPKRAIAGDARGARAA